MTAFFWLTYVFLYLLVFAQTLILVGLLSREASRRSLGRTHEVAPATVVAGTPLPELSGFTLEDRANASWDALLQPGRNLLVFLTPHCTSCDKVGRLLDAWLASSHEHAVVFGEGRPEDVIEFVRRTRLNPARVVVDEHGITGKAMGFEIRPGAVTVLDRRLALSAVTESTTALDDLVQRTLEIGGADGIADALLVASDRQSGAA